MGPWGKYFEDEDYGIYKNMWYFFRMKSGILI